MKGVLFLGGVVASKKNTKKKGEIKGNHSTPWIEKMLKNRSIFMKTGEAGFTDF
jgi:hypothetical protein